MLRTNDIEVKVIGGGIGPVSNSDVNLAESTGAFIIGFNMNPTTSAKRLAQDKGIDVKVYSIIYEIIDDVKAAIEGLLVPDSVEEYIGRADVKETFVVPKIGVIAGSFVVDGKIIVGHSVRLLRDGLTIYEGSISSLRRFKDDVKEVKNHLECGIGIENFNDIKVGDTIECFSIVEKKKSYDEVVKEEALKAKMGQEEGSSPSPEYTMAKNFKKKQYEVRILGEINNVLRFRLSDKRLRFVSATKVELTPDYSMAFVYWDTFDPSKRGESKRAVGGIAGKMRTLLAQTLKVKHMPQLQFRYDERYESEKTITELLNARPGQVE